MNMIHRYFFRIDKSIEMKMERMMFIIDTWISVARRHVSFHTILDMTIRILKTLQRTRAEVIG